MNEYASFRAEVENYDIGLSQKKTVNAVRFKINLIITTSSHCTLYS